MYAQPPLRLLPDTVRLFLLVDLPFQLVVDSMNPSLALILQSVLNDPADMLEQTEGTHGRKPVAAGADAVQKLLGVDIPDDVMDKVVAGVKGKLAGDNVADAVSKLKKLF